jgi:hypothetical protein
MLWMVTTITFVATVAVLTALFYALVPGEMGIAERFNGDRGTVFALDSAAAAATGA